MTTKELEYNIACYFDFRKNMIIPNISWGFGTHECDLLIVKPSLEMIEVELKISKSDLKADLKKKHHHKDNRIAYLYYALPEDIYEECKEYIPEHAGILLSDSAGWVRKVKSPKKNTDSVKITQEDLIRLLRLGNIRTWSLRKKELESLNILPAPKRETRRERYNKDMYSALLNMYNFLSRKQYTNPELVKEQAYYIERTLDRIDKKGMKKV